MDYFMYRISALHPQLTLTHPLNNTELFLIVAFNAN